MALTHRIRKLEYKIGFRGACPLCNDEGRHSVAMREEDEELDTTGLGCPACGRVGVVKVIILKNSDHRPDIAAIEKQRTRNGAQSSSSAA